MKKNMEEFVDKVQLQLSHVDPLKTVNIGFYDKHADNVSELRPLIDKATDWRDEITKKLQAKMPVRA